MSKPIKLFLFLLTVATQIYADPLSANKSVRMREIEARFNVRMVGILRTKERDYWVFLESSPVSSRIKVFPVVIPENGTDHDVLIAQIAAENVVAFLETSASPFPTPAGNTFTMPTHTPEVAAR